MWVGAYKVLVIAYHPTGLLINKTFGDLSEQIYVSSCYGIVISLCSLVSSISKKHKQNIMGEIIASPNNSFKNQCKVRVRKVATKHLLSFLP